MNTKKISLFFIIFIVSFLELKAQNFFFLGTKSYPATQEFYFEFNKKSFDQLGIVIAKKSDGSGLIILSKKIYNDKQYISGNIYIYLYDGTTILCKNRGLYDIVDNKTKTVYFLTKDEMQKLLNTNIHTIRFSVTEIQNFGAFQDKKIKNYTASNKETSIMTHEVKEPVVDIPALLRKLYEK